MHQRQLFGWMMAAIFSSGVPLQAQFTQSGSKLVGVGSIGAPLQGTSVALSADGSTAVVGGPVDNGGAGAAWVYNTATGQSIKLVGAGATGGTGIAGQGSAVAVSADGNTVVVGGSNDNTGTGAMWMFARANGVWTQQAKLWGTVLSGISHQGASVAVSADGNSAIIGGYQDNNYLGAAWVFTRTNGVWSIAFDKLVGAGNSGQAYQGMSVALSADGNTALIGGPADNSGTGSAWVFTRTGVGAPWSQQAKLNGFNTAGAAAFGNSVALSSDGNTALIGGPGDNTNTGAIWVFTRANGQWTQQGSKLVGTDPAVSRYLGLSVALSGDGNTALAGGPGGIVSNLFARKPSVGATWTFTRISGSWSQQGAEFTGTGTVNNDALQGTAVALSTDGRTAIVGGPADGNDLGAAWLFTQPAPPSPPVITTQPASQTLASGQSVTLNVAAMGPSLSYQWYQGPAGNTSTPVGTNSPSFTTPALTTTTSYWVLVSNPFGTLNSTAAVITVSSNFPLISSVTNAASYGGTIAPNTWVAIQGANLAPAGDTRTWQAADFVNNQMPTQLDGVSATVNGKSAYIYYISPTQVNILTPTDALQGSVQVVLTKSGAASAPFSVPGQAVSPSFFFFGSGPYVAAVHIDGGYLGPLTLYPGVTTPAKPGETIELYANGFGATSPAVTPGLDAQSAPLPSMPVVVIGGINASVTFAGLVSPGEFQFNVVVPLNAQAGDNALTAVYNGVTTQSGVLLSIGQ